MGSYPRPFDQPCVARARQPVARSQGLTHFGVNLTVIPPGGWSSQRHWHSHEDEFVWILEGELTLVTDAGEEILRAGDCAAFVSRRFGRRLRVEHWDSAIHAPEVVAANILGGDERYDPVPYFWSEQFGRMVQYCGQHSPSEIQGSASSGRHYRCTRRPN